MTPRPFVHPLLLRQRLIDRLEHGRSLTVLRAPTGFGKSTLVRQWAERLPDDAVLASVRVRPGEGDFGSFWISVMEALADAGLDEPALLNARSPQSSVARMITTAGRPLVLWVDSFENVSTVDADEVLLDLVHHVPGFRLLVGTRSHRQFGAHLLGDLDADVLDSDDLLFDAEETEALVRAAGLDLAPGTVAVVQESSGGWPELVRTYVGALRHGEGLEAGRRPLTPVEVQATLDHVLANWLRRRLLPGVKRPELIDFAAVTAVPDQVTAAIAEVLTGDPDAKARFEILVAEGALVPVQDDSARVSYRWPATARRALLGELRHRHPERLPPLHERIARWYVDQDRPAAALHHAVQAAAWPVVVEIIDRFWRRLLFHHRTELNEAFLATPADAIAGSRPVGAARAIRTLFLRTDDPAIGADVLPATDEALAGLGSSADPAGVLSTGLAVLVALRTPERLSEAAVLADRLVRVADAARAQRPGEVADLYPSVHFYAGETLLSLGELASGMPHLEEAYRRAEDSSLGYLHADAAGKLAVAHALAGDLPNADAWLRRHEEAPRVSTWLSPYVRATTQVARLLVAVDRLDLATATHAANDLLGNVLPDIRWAQELYARSLLAVHQGTAASVLEEIDHARRGHQAVPAAAEPLVAAVEADLLLALGQGNQARAILHGAHRGDPHLRVGQTRLALLAGDPAGALALTGDAGWERVARNRQRQEMLLLRAVAAHRVGDDGAARDALQTAAAAAHATGAVRCLTTVPRPDLDDLAADVPVAAALLQHPRLTGNPPVYPGSVRLIELTPREQQVLDRIARGLSVRQAAVDLHVTYSTIRTQQRSLYRKLGVDSQQDAVARARQAGLLGTGD